MKKYLSFIFVAVLFSTAFAVKVSAASKITAPVVTTVSSALSNTSANLNGSLDSLGGAASAKVGFSYTAGSGSPVKLDAGSKSANGPFTATISNPQCGVTYVFNAYTDTTASGGSIAQGKTLSFKTADCSKNSPTVITVVGATSITSNSATLNFNIDSMGPLSSIDFSYTLSPGGSIIKVSPAITKTGPVSYVATGLQCNTNYYFKPSMNIPFTIKVTSYNFTTSACGNNAASVVALPPTNITDKGVTLNGSIVSMGNFPSVNIGFETSIGLLMPAASSQINPKRTVGDFSVATLQPLPCNTSFTYTPFLETSSGRVYPVPPVKNTVSLSCGSNGGNPSVTSLNATSITQTSAVLNASLDSLGGAKSANVGFTFSNTPGNVNVGPLQNTGRFSFTVDKLTCGTQYSFRTFANTDSSGSVTTPGLTFSTLPCVANANGIPLPKAFGSSATNPASITVNLSQIVDVPVASGTVITKPVDMPVPIPSTLQVIPTPSQPISKLAPSNALGAFDSDQDNSSVDNSQTVAVASETPATPTPTQTNSKFVFNKNLSYGSTGQDVSELQKILSEKGYMKDVLLGDFFGKKTSSALKKFQSDNGLPSAGVVGPATIKLLNS